MTLEHIVNCHEPSSKVFIFGQQSISRVQVYLAKLQLSSLGSQAIWQPSFSEVLNSFPSLIQLVLNGCLECGPMNEFKGIASHGVVFYL